jgi:hypothetical protein
LALPSPLGVPAWGRAAGMRARQGRSATQRWSRPPRTASCLSASRLFLRHPRSLRSPLQQIRRLSAPASGRRPLSGLQGCFQRRQQARRGHCRPPTGGTSARKQASGTSFALGEVRSSDVVLITAAGVECGQGAPNVGSIARPQSPQMGQRDLLRPSSSAAKSAAHDLFQDFASACYRAMLNRPVISIASAWVGSTKALRSSA